MKETRGWAWLRCGRGLAVVLVMIGWKLEWAWL